MHGLRYVRADHGVQLMRIRPDAMDHGFLTVAGVHLDDIAGKPSAFPAPRSTQKIAASERGLARGLATNRAARVKVKLPTLSIQRDD